MRLVSDFDVMRMLYGLGGSCLWRRTFPETAQAISDASNDDPIFPEQECGAEATACILVADAWRATRCNPQAMTVKNVGIFQLRPPELIKVYPGLLTNSRTAALVAIDLIRSSIIASDKFPWCDRLIWYHQLAQTPREAHECSRVVMRQAQDLFATYFSPPDKRLSIQRLLPS